MLLAKKKGGGMEMKQAFLVCRQRRLLGKSHELAQQVIEVRFTR